MQFKAQIPCGQTAASTWSHTELDGSVGHRIGACTFPAAKATLQSGGVTTAGADTPELALSSACWSDNGSETVAAWSVTTRG